MSSFWLIQRVWKFVGGSSAAVPWYTCQSEESAMAYCRKQKELIDQARETDPHFSRILQAMGVIEVGHTFLHMQDPDARVILPPKQPLVLP